jgi:hypothetical protein
VDVELADVLGLVDAVVGVGAGADVLGELVVCCGELPAPVGELPPPGRST